MLRIVTYWDHCNCIQYICILIWVHFPCPCWKDIRQNVNNIHKMFPRCFDVYLIDLKFLYMNEKIPAEIHFVAFWRGWLLPLQKITNGGSHIMIKIEHRLFFLCLNITEYLVMIVQNNCIIKSFLCILCGTWSFKHSTNKEINGLTTVWNIPKWHGHSNI